MELPPISTPDQHTDKSQSSEVIPEQREEGFNDDTEIIIKANLEKGKRVQYIGRIRKAWEQVEHALSAALNMNDENKWGQEMLDLSLIHI